MANAGKFIRRHSREIVSAQALVESRQSMCAPSTWSVTRHDIRPLNASRLTSVLTCGRSTVLAAVGCNAVSGFALTEKGCHQAKHLAHSRIWQPADEFGRRLACSCPACGVKITKRDRHGEAHSAVASPCLATNRTPRPDLGVQVTFRYSPEEIPELDVT